MRVAYSVLLLLFAAGMAGTAQRSASYAIRKAAVCPGSLTARHQGGPEVQWTLARQDQENQQQEDQYRPDAKPLGHVGVHVALASPKAVRQIELAVQFVPPGARLAPLDSGKRGRQHEESKTFELNSAEGAKTVEGDLLVGAVFKITRVRLLSVQYADGSSWHGMLNSCSVEPSLYMPVEAK